MPEPTNIGGATPINYWRDVQAQYGLPRREDIDYYYKYYRFGVFDPYNEPDSGKEFIFFVKPNLCIMEGGKLIDELANVPFFQELALKWPNVIYQLQYDADPVKCPFSLLLSNMVSSSLDLPSVSATTVQNPTNMFGTSYDYRWTSEASDDNHSFSLEFKDTKNLDVYMLFRAYEEYERLKAQGWIKLYQHPVYKRYIQNKVLHDQFGIYKFIVAEDMETIVHYSYMTGVYFASLPRDSFNDANFDEGIKYGIDMKAAFVDDMDPLIIRDFNLLAKPYVQSYSNNEVVSVYDYENLKTNLTPVTCPVIERTTARATMSNRSENYVYKLKFFGLR